MSLFQYGNKYYSDRLCNMDDDELRNIYHLYQIKYWGFVDNENWQKNDVSALSDNGGRIEAKYITENGKEITLVRLADCSYLLFLTEEDIKEDFEEKFKKKIKEEIESLSQRITTSYSGIRRSTRRA